MTTEYTPGSLPAHPTARTGPGNNGWTSAEKRTILDYARAEVARETAELRAEVERLRAALLKCARQAEALKRDCSMDPESKQAQRNAQYQSISTTAHIALGTIQGPRE